MKTRGFSLVGSWQHEEFAGGKSNMTLRKLKPSPRAGLKHVNTYEYMQQKNYLKQHV